MNTNKKLFWIALVCVLLAAGIYAYGYWKIRTHLTPPESVHTKVSAATVDDGTYTVYLRTIMTTPEDTAITWSHVTYFEGAEASSSAAYEVKCDDQPLEVCVPTLARGYYVRESGAPDFIAPITADTEIVLKDKSDATLRDLQNIIRTAEPVFDIQITNGNVTLITEKSPL